jgi:hypothetical protein
VSSGSLLFKNLFRDWFSVLMLIVLTFSITESGLLVVRGIDQITYLTRLCEKAGMEDKLFYSDQVDDGLGLAKQASLIEDISGVSEVEVTETCLLFCKKVEMNVIYYDTPALQNLKYPLAEGAYPDAEATNQVILPYAYKLFFKVGDEIDVSFVNDENWRDTVYPSITIRVSGFLMDSTTLSLSPIGARTGLGGLFSAQTDTGIAYRLVDSSGQPMQGNLQSLFIITPEDGADLQSLKEKITTVVRSKSYVFSYRELVTEYWKSNDRIVSMFFTSAVSNLSLAFALLFAGTYLSLISRRKEMSVWYLSGTGWTNSVKMLLTPKLLAIIVGYLTGLFQFYRQFGTEYTYQIYVNFRWSYIFITFGIVIFMFLAGVLPFYIVTIRKSPVELFRKD